MAREARTEIQKSEKGVPTVAEQTRSGPVYSPAVDIFENDNSITVLADMPGVKAQDLQIDLRESVLTLTGRVSTPETPTESDVLREYRSGTFFRQFTLAETVDQARRRRAETGAAEGREGEAAPDYGPYELTRLRPRDTSSGCFSVARTARRLVRSVGPVAGRGPPFHLVCCKRRIASVIEGEP
jgi:HSP20 family protein